MAKSGPGGPVWAKRVGDEAVAAQNIAFCAGWDVRSRPEADRILIPYDLATNVAHAIMLGERKILGADESRAILGALLDVRRRVEAKENILRPECEDVHMSIESVVTELAGPEAGGRLHTGRSRNDQIATDMRLWLRDRIAGTAAETADLIATLLDHAADHAETACPGFTHMQPAMIGTWGHFATAFAARLVRDLRAFRHLLDESDECPLGSAASYGTSWPIDRERTAALLGFARPAVSTVDAASSRGELEGRFAYAAAQLLTHLSGIGQDLILLSTPPRDWLRIPDAFVTGSSIMPQKRNPDFAEVTRARAATAAGLAQAFLGIAHAAPSGYNRDTQWTKYLAMQAADEIAGAPRVFTGVFAKLEVHTDRMSAACRQGFLNATDAADFLAQSRSLAFRDCYRVVGRAVKACEATGELDRTSINAELRALDKKIKPLTAAEMKSLADPILLLSKRTQTGSPNPAKTRAAIAQLREESSAVAAEIAKRAAQWNARIDALWSQAKVRARA